MVRLKDIATKAQVSTASVSLALNDKYPKGISLSEEKRRTIKKVARQMGYRNDDLARSIRTGKARVIGYIAPDITSEYYSRFLSGIMDEAAKHSYYVKFIPLSEARELDQLIHVCVSQRLSGIIDRSSLRGDDKLQLASRLAERNIKLVSLVNPLPGGMNVTAGYRAGIFAALKHFSDMGHKRVSLFGSVPATKKHYTAQLYQQEARKFDFASADNIRINFDLDNMDQQEAKNEIAAWLKGLQFPHAVLCTTDNFALFLLCYAKELGIKIPEDLSIIGIGGLKFGRVCTPVLTTVTHCYEKIGARAVEILLDESNQGKEIAETIDDVLIEGNSVANLHEK